MFIRLLVKGRRYLATLDSAGLERGGHRPVHPAGGGGCRRRAGSHHGRAGAAEAPDRSAAAGAEQPGFRGCADGPGGLHPAADGPGWVDRAEHGWGADVGGGGEGVSSE